MIMIRILTAALVRNFDITPDIGTDEDAMYPRDSFVSKPPSLYLLDAEYIFVRFYFPRLESVIWFLLLDRTKSKCVTRTIFHHLLTAMYYLRRCIHSLVQRVKL